MVSTTIDPLKPSVLNLTLEEIADIELEISRGNLPPDWLRRCSEARALQTFGHDAKRDRHGNYIEQGLGSAQNQSANSVAAYQRFCQNEPNYLKNLARMQAELEQSNARRKAAAAQK